MGGRDARRTVTADWLVLATNGYTDELWPRLGQTMIPVYSGIRGHRTPSGGHRQANLADGDRPL